MRVVLLCLLFSSLGSQQTNFVRRNPTTCRIHSKSSNFHLHISHYHSMFILINSFYSNSYSRFFGSNNVSNHVFESNNADHFGGCVHVILYNSNRYDGTKVSTTTRRACQRGH